MTDSQKMIVVQDKLNEVETDCERLTKLVLTGNGEPSLMERVRNVEAFVKEARYWAKFIAGALVVQAITLIIAAFAYLIKAMP